MQCAACGPDAPDALLEWIAARLGGVAGLAERPGARVRWHPRGKPAPAGIGGAMARAGPGGCPVLPVPGWEARLVRTGPQAVVAARREARFGPGETALLRRGAALMRLALGEEEAARARQGILQLLIAGHDDAARFMARAVLSLRLPGTVSVVLVDGPPRGRGETARACESAVPAAIAVRCPVFSRHVVVVTDAGDAGAIARIRRACPGMPAAAGGPVPLRDVRVSYDQALNRLILGSRPGGAAGGPGAAGLAAALGPSGAAWARQRLAPLADGGGPGEAAERRRAERLEALAAWLEWGTVAGADALHVHRNVLSARVSEIRALGEDLGRQDVRAQLHLAARLYGADPGAGTGTGPLSWRELLGRPSAREWAARLLAPLAGDQALTEAVRAWAQEGGLWTTAARDLGIAPKTAWDRLLRAEALLGMALVSRPEGSRRVPRSASYDLYAAFAALDG